MEFERDVLVSPTGEVPVIEGEVVTAIRTLADRGVGKKTIAREVGVALNTVRRYLRQPIAPGRQVRPGGRLLTGERREEARTLYVGPAEGNAVVVQRLLAERGLTVSVRTLERAVADIPRERRVASLATVRVETPPGNQLQIDFGQKRLQIGGVRVARTASSRAHRNDTKPSVSAARPRRSGRCPVAVLVELSSSADPPGALRNRFVHPGPSIPVSALLSAAAQRRTARIESAPQDSLPRKTRRRLVRTTCTEISMNAWRNALNSLRRTAAFSAA